MDNIKPEKSNAKTSESENPYTSITSLEDRLKVIANLIVDRMIEDQQEGIQRQKHNSK